MTTGVRYSTVVMVRAGELRDAGWSYPQVRRLLAREFGTSPHETTLRKWLDPRSAKRRLVWSNAYERRRKASLPRRFPRVSEEWRTARMRDLAEAGVPARWIGVVAGVWWGVGLSEHGVRNRLGAGR